MRRKVNLTARLNRIGDILIRIPTEELNAIKAVEKPSYIDLNRIFQNDNPVELEIGCGKGGFIVQKARNNPNINYVAVELISNVLIEALENEENNLPNLRFLNCGAEYLLRYFKNDSFNNLYLNFSVPYERGKNENRRLTYKYFLDIYSKIIVNNGKIYQKTDNKNLYDYSLYSYENSGFTIIEKSENLYENLPKDNIQTEYESKFVSMGQPIYYIVAKNVK